MNQSVATPAQIRGVLPALRKHRGLTQTQLGALIGVSQKRIARIEANPAKTSFDQISKLITVLGGDLVVTDKSAGTRTKAVAKPAGKTGDQW